MTTLRELKSTIDSMATAAGKTGSNLAQFDRTFAQHTQEVQRAMGGSTQRKDKEVLDALQQASRAVKQAVQALQQAAKIAKNYGQSL